jgi:hypothetical protein
MFCSGGGKEDGYVLKLDIMPCYWGSDGLDYTNCFCCFSKSGCYEDFLFYLFNQHGFLSTFCCDKDHPYSRMERAFSFFVLASLTYLGVTSAASLQLQGTDDILWSVCK